MCSTDSFALFSSCFGASFPLKELGEDDALSITKLTEEFQSKAIISDDFKKMAKLAEKLSIGLPSVKENRELFEKGKNELIKQLKTKSTLEEISKHHKVLLQEIIYYAIRIDSDCSWCIDLLCTGTFSEEFALILESAFKKMAETERDSKLPFYKNVATIASALEYFNSLSKEIHKEIHIKDLLFLAFFSEGFLPQFTLKSSVIYEHGLTRIPHTFYDKDSKLNKLRDHYFSMIITFISQMDEFSIDYEKQTTTLSETLGRAMEMDPLNRCIETIFSKLFTVPFRLSFIAKLQNSSQFYKINSAKKLLDTYCMNSIKTDLVLPTDAPSRLKSFATAPLSDDTITLIRKIFKRVKKEQPTAAHVLQIDHVFRIFDSFYAARLTRFERTREGINFLRIALFCEELSRQTSDSTPKYYSRSETGTGFPMLYSSAAKIAVIFARKNETVLHAYGSYKKVRSAILLSLSGSPRSDVVTRLYTRKRITDEQYQIAVKEVALYLQFRGKPGITQMLMATVIHKTTSKGVTTKCLELQFEWFDKDLSKSTKIRKSQTDFMPFAQMTKQCIHGVFSLHKEGYIHGDLKPENLLVTENTSTEPLRAAVGDLGYAIQVKNGKKAPPEIYGLALFGYYGTPAYTAPELFGVKDFHDDYFKLDVWALGMSFYKRRFNDTLPWESIITNCFESKHHLEPEKLKNAQLQVVSLIRSTIEDSKYFNHYLAEKKRGVKLPLVREIDLLIYSMLRLNPMDRITIAQAKDEIRRILKEDPTESKDNVHLYTS